MRQKKGSVYQPCSGSQLTCFLGFSIGNFISNSVLSQNVEEFVQCGKRNTEKIDKSRRLLLTHLRHTMFSWMWTWVSFVRRNKRIAKPHCLPQLSPSSSAFFFLHLAWTRGVRLTDWDTCKPITRPHPISYSNIHTHTQQWSRPGSQQECVQISNFAHAARTTGKDALLPSIPKAHYSTCLSL